jgi:hypothetical protein
MSSGALALFVRYCFGACIESCHTSLALSMRHFPSANSSLAVSNCPDQTLPQTAHSARV